MNQFNLKPCTLNVLRALSVMCIAAPLIAHAQQATDLGTVGASGTGTTDSSVPTASKVAPVQGNLDAREAQSIVNDNYVRDYTAPVADYSQAFLLVPGAFSYSPNGVGEGNAGTNIRGLTDSQYLVEIDGIPFNDTNGVSHHSYLFAPAQAIGGAVIDRGPGSAATIGQATFGGTFNLLTRTLTPQESTSLTGSYGSWDTRLIDLQHQTGQYGQDGASSFFFDAQNMKSNGYQTYDFQDREAFSGKYQYIVSSDTVLTAFSSYMQVRNNQLDAGASTRAQIAQYGNNYLSSDNPALPNYYGYNYYYVTTLFSYVDVASNLGNGWKLDDKVYDYNYHNKENYAGSSVPVAVGALPATANDKVNDTGVDKLNSYHTFGNLLRLTDDTTTGTLRTGMWTELADSYRYQIPANILNWADGPTPNFSETYQTLTVQPYIEYEYKVSKELSLTAGVKYANYEQDYLHLQDLKKVGALGGTLNSTTNVITGGSPSVSNEITYRDILPSLDVHYWLQPNWSAYAQYAYGDLIPPTTVFDVKNAAVDTPPKVQQSKTFQIGTVYKADRFNFDADIYHVKLDNSYTCATDPSNPTEQSCVASGTEITQGVELEGTTLLGHGLSLYADATLGTTKYETGQWVPGAPGNTEKLGLMYTEGAWDSMLFGQRVGKLYNAGANANIDSYTIDPVVLTNLFINYTFKTPTTFIKKTKVQLAINNLFDQHSITAISGNGTGVNAAPAPSDVLTLLPGRSVALTLTLDF